jgi:3-dehydroquinate dehydratase/shikimate dehydrogenase
MTPLCVPIFIKSGIDLEETLAAAEDALDGTDGLLELRCDTATPKQMLEAIDLARLPVIVTLRPTWEGGFSQKSDTDRIAMWEEAMEAGADSIDVELVAWEKSRPIREAIEDAAEKFGTRLILSNHSFDRRPKDLPERIARLRAIKPARLLKIAWKAESLLDALDALRLTSQLPKDDPRPLLALAMGEEGQLSRLLARKFNAPLTFASIERGKESAPGQPTVDELRTRYRWNSQQFDTPTFGVVGWPVSHSLSPHIHNAGFDAVNTPGVYVPLAIQPTYEAFSTALDAMRTLPNMNLRGLSITIPHKENAMGYAKEHHAAIDPLSQHIGVINTLIWNDHGNLKALNSDYAGALDALATAYDGNRNSLAGKRIAVLGAGGAARAIVAGLAAHGATVVIYNRTPEKAQALAKEFNTPDSPGKIVAAPWEKLCDSCCEAYINCTPLGMHPNLNTSPIDESAPPKWTADTVVFDTVYNPLKTKFIKQAERKNAKTVLGTEMFIRQAAIQFQEFTHHAAPIETFRSILLAALKSNK